MFPTLERIDHISITIKGGQDHSAPWIVVDTVDIGAARAELLTIFGLTEETEVEHNGQTLTLAQLSLTDLAVYASRLFQGAYSGARGAGRVTRTEAPAKNAPNANPDPASKDQDALAAKIEAVKAQIDGAGTMAALKQLFNIEKDLISQNEALKTAFQAKGKSFS